jgi:hypothetical protein
VVVVGVFFFLIGEISIDESPSGAFAVEGSTVDVVEGDREM